MSTRSYIAKEHNDGSITAIYCHFDGYIEGVGQTLYENYNTNEKIDELLTLGDLSSLGPTPNESKAYHRDYNEKLHIAEYNKLSEFLNMVSNSWAEYVYIWRYGRWQVSDDVKNIEDFTTWSILKNRIGNYEE